VTQHFITTPGVHRCCPLCVGWEACRPQRLVVVADIIELCQLSEALGRARPNRKSGALLAVPTQFQVLPSNRGVSSESWTSCICGLLSAFAGILRMEPAGIEPATSCLQSVTLLGKLLALEAHISRAFGLSASRSGRSVLGHYSPIWAHLGAGFAGRPQNLKMVPRRRLARSTRPLGVNIGRVCAKPLSCGGDH
jgi:hypothetical protein